MTQMAADWEDRLRLSAPFVEQRLEFDGYERRISTPRTQRGDHRCRHESAERSKAGPRRKDLRKLAYAGTDCPRSSGRAAETFPSPLSCSSGRHIDPGHPR